MVSCTFPSSVPTQRILGSSGDSAKFEISLIASPSLREMRMSRFTTPIMEIVSRLIERVRSILLVQDDPKSNDVKSLLPPRYTVPDRCREAINGASQSNR